MFGKENRGFLKKIGKLEIVGVFSEGFKFFKKR
jgi:hypothetical protein